MTWTYTDEWYKQYTHDTWNEAAEAYRPWVELYRPFDEPLLSPLQLAPGQRVLDLATGPGEPALTIARQVAPDGEVVGVDLAENMVDIARRNAKEQGVDNVAFEAMDAEALDLDDASFDAVVSRFGVNLFTDPDQALAEAFRVLEPGGRASFLVWSSPGEASPALHVIVGPMLEFAEPDETGYLPTPYELGEEGVMTGMLEEAGFGDCVEEKTRIELAFDGPDAYLQAALEGSPLGHSLQEEDEDVQEAVLKMTRENLEEWRADDGRIVLPAEAVVASARKPGPDP